MTAVKGAGYVETYLTRETLQLLEAGAYRQLCEHLKQRSEEVQNIDLMTISGFCRNCLAKWLVLEARRLSDELKTSNSVSNDEVNSTIRALDALGYDEAADYVYGMHYGDWKKRYAKQATDSVIGKYNASKAIHATHDKELLATKAEKPENPAPNKDASNPTLLSNVCCQDPELVVPKPTAPIKNTRKMVQQLPPPPSSTTKFKLSILTISDRASSGQYETGDLSGPAVAQSVASVAKGMGDIIEYELMKTEIVPDNVEEIQLKLKEWSSGDAAVDLILTTGGTGFARRDVTPEATRGVLDEECHGLMSYVASECSKFQPLSTLSRGTAGVVRRTLIANLPGNPKGVGEILPLLLPLTLHAIVDLQA